MVIIAVRIRKIYLAVLLGISSVCPFPEMKVVLLRRAMMMIIKIICENSSLVVRLQTMMMMLTMITDS